MTGPPRSRTHQARFIVAIVALAAIWLEMLVWGGGTLDRQFYELLYSGHLPALAAIAHFFTAFGQSAVLITAAFAATLWLLRVGRTRLAIALLLVTLLGRGMVELQKYSIARVRPDIEPHLVVVKTSSFPSGHATNSMIFCLALALALARGTRWQTPAVAGAILMTLLIGTSRVMLGVHWPSDVIGGWAFGMLWVLLTLRLAERMISDVG
jgi:membrane-associated phospholipid phosphatase